MLSLSHDANDTVSSKSVDKDLVNENARGNTIPPHEQTSFSQTASEEIDYHAYETVFSIEPEMVQHTKTPAIPTEYTWGTVAHTFRKPINTRLIINQLTTLFFIYLAFSPRAYNHLSLSDFLVPALFIGYSLLLLAYTLLKNPLALMRAKLLYAPAMNNDILAMKKVLAIAFSMVDWLRPTKATFDISPDAKSVIVSITLPDVDSMLLVKKTAKKKKLKIKKEQTDADLAHDYLIYVHGVLIRTAGICFSLFPVEKVICNGVTSHGSCILSTSFDLSKWKKESPTTENPLKCIEHFTYHRNITESESLKTVTPLLQKKTLDEVFFENSKGNAPHESMSKALVSEKVVNQNTDKVLPTYIHSKSMLNYEAYTKAFSPEPGILEHTKTPKIPFKYTWIFFPKLLKNPILTRSTVLWIIAALLPWGLIQYVHDHPDHSDPTGGAAAFFVLFLTSFAIAIYPAFIIIKNLMRRAATMATYVRALRNNTSAMKKVLTIAFKNAKWFRRVKVSFILFEKAKTISVTITLPYVDAMKFDKKGVYKKILYTIAVYRKDIITDKEQSYDELVHDYLIYAHGVLIRTAGICFSLFPFERVTCHGITPKGKSVLSVSFDKETWKQENPREQNPLLFIEKFTYARKITEKGELEKVSLCYRHSF